MSVAERVHECGEFGGLQALHGPDLDTMTLRPRSSTRRMRQTIVVVLFLMFLNPFPASPVSSLPARIDIAAVRSYFAAALPVDACQLSIGFNYDHRGLFLQTRIMRDVLGNKLGAGCRGVHLTPDHGLVLGHHCQF